MIANEQIRKYVTDEQLLECLILFEKRKIDASKMLSSYMFPKYKATTLECVKILTNLQKHFL